MSFFNRIGDFKNDFDKYSGKISEFQDQFDRFREGFKGFGGGSHGGGRRRCTTIPGRSVKPRSERKNPFAGLAEQNYDDIKKTCLEQGIQFEDPEFPAVDTSIFFSSKPPRPFEWKRPHEICENPEWISDGASRFDVRQGELGDCWLLAAVASLTCNPKLFNWVVDPTQNFTDDYCGLFKFTFWHQGDWQEVVVDDRLPTYRNQLVFMHSTEKNEFWSALLEKAYAKLMGSYESLKGGSSSEAMEDFTGGVTEMFDLQKAPPNLLNIMLKAHDRGSLMGCSIDADPNKLEAELANGLIMGHAYSVTSVQLADIKTSRMSGQIPMVRVRNPWGNGSEWKGAWSDGSREWSLLSEEEKQELGLNFEDDGEFWMSFQDFTSNFQKLEICNLGPDSLDEDDLSNKKKWECHKESGSWIKRVNAGGCRNYLDTFWTNPQFRMTLTDPDEDDDENLCTALVAILQKDRRKKRMEGLDLLTIGYVIYKLEDPNCGPLDMKYFKYHASVAKSPTFINMREVCGRHKLEPGTYAIIPSTFEPHYEGEFLIRIFTEKPNVSGEDCDGVPHGSGAEIDQDTHYEEET
ncbi:calpain-a, partial [Plakobranchus ocellatus]